MIIYYATLRYESLKTRREDKDTLNPDVDKKKLKDMISEINDTLGKECGLDGNISVVIVDGKVGAFDIVMACMQENVSDTEGMKWIRAHFASNYSVKKVWFEKRREISSKEFRRVLDRAENKGYGHQGWIWRDLGFDYFDNCQFHVQESLYGKDDISKDAVFEKATEVMADKTLMEELDRIYAVENEKKYYGNPVHYLIKAGTSEAAKDMIEVLMLALRMNSRLLGSRLTYVSEIEEGCYGEDDLKNLFKVGKGEAVAIDMSGSDSDHGVYASSYHRVISFVADLVRDTNLYTLCFFVEITEKPGFTKSLIATVQDDIHLIEIKEGRGDRKQALDYLSILTKRSKFAATPDELENALPKRKDYSASDVYATYSKWFSNGLKSKVYQSYKTCEKIEIKVDKPSDKPYEKLQSMVGLSEIKTLVDQIINTAKIKKARSSYGMDTHNISQHMLFTGNPGSAKTTVARLIAEILKKEETIETGNFVECGRADLVARYVGWTAKTVREKFNEANGGILFIDEAYSLVDDSNSFGAEAINTIVQEMENRRDSVIVIFAGYPDKMEKFLNENEGLRSRIAFHLDFPDYNADEMLQILELMAREKGYKINGEIREKCHEIFVDACSQPEFGNGRFARNVLEQAMMRQADRVVKTAKGKSISKRNLTTFIADDFVVNAGKCYGKKKNEIGFV